MNVACDYEAPMQMLTTEKYIAAGGGGTAHICQIYRDVLPKWVDFKLFYT